MSEISSMTGFGEASLEVQSTGSSIRVQFKSVNSRFLDLSVRLPALYGALEAEVQKRVKAKLKRGRVEISAFRFSPLVVEGSKFNSVVLENFLSQLEAVEIKGLNKKETLQVLLPAILTRKEIFEGSESEPLSDDEKIVFFKTLDDSLVALLKSRELEGESLHAEIQLQLSNLSKITGEIDSLSTQAPNKTKEKFEQRLKELLAGSVVSPDRLEQEVAILADRIDVREELVRLKSHLTLFKSSIPEGGRKLEFVLQEMGREVNTVGSKSNEASISTLVIEAKSILEKIREQIQNVE